MKTILALDLGGSTGWAYRASDGKITAGTWVLAKEADTKKAAKLRLDRRLDPRIPALYYKLENHWNTYRHGPFVGPNNPIDMLVFEDVEFSKYRLQTQLWASYRGAVWIFCNKHTIVTDCINVKSLKLFGTGSGGAEKDFMIAAAQKLFPNIVIVDDNCADALHLLQWAMTITKTLGKR